MQDSATYPLRFETAPLELEPAFDGGRITSDGGLLQLAEADRDPGLCDALAEHVPEWRASRSVEHPLLALVRQRIFYRIAAGVRGPERRRPPAKRPAPETRVGVPARDRGAPCEPAYPLAPGKHPGPRTARASGGLYIRERGKGAASEEEVLLDFDATDDPAHGEQEGAFYHGYYGTRMYHPLPVFDGRTNQLVTAILRAGNTHASRGALAVLKRVVDRLRESWPGVKIEIRADAGFAAPGIYGYCEGEEIGYTIGLVSNPRLEVLAQDLLQGAKRKFQEAAGEKV